MVRLEVCHLTSRKTDMPRKRPRPYEIVARLRQVDVLTAQGQSMAGAIRQIGVSEATFYRWRQEFGGLKTDQPGTAELQELSTIPEAAQVPGFSQDGHGVDWSNPRDLAQ
jgi:transposase-like protein